MLACRKLIFKGRYLLILVLEGSFYDGQCSLWFCMWLHAHNFLITVLSIVFILHAKLNKVKKLCIIHQDDAKVTETWLYSCLYQSTFSIIPDLQFCQENFSAEA